MTRHRLSPGPRHAKGFSLIELMVSLVIGLIIAIAAVSAYLGSAGAGRVAEAQSRMNEDAQAALNILTQQLRMAGNNPVQAGRIAAFSHNPVYDYTYLGGSAVPSDTSTFTLTTSNSRSDFTVRGCDGKFNAISTAGGTLDTLDTSTCASGASAIPDSIAINYEADRYNTVPTLAGLPTDCLGNALSTAAATATFPSGTVTTASYAIADNRFYIGTSTVIVSPSLYCKGNGGASTAQPLVENVEDMQFTYGTVSTSTTSTTATVAGYLRADQVINDANLALLPVQERWGKVLTVRICIVVRSENPVASDAASAQYVKCDGTLDTTQTDLRLRRAYSTTVVLRNRRS